MAGYGTMAGYHLQSCLGTQSNIGTFGEQSLRVDDNYVVTIGITDR